jgi:TonB family protein
MNGPRNRPVFNDSILPDGRTRWDLFGASFGVECIILAALVIVPILMPQKLEAVKRFWVMTPLEPPPVRAWKPQPRPKPRLVAVKREVMKEIPKPEEVVMPKPKIYNPVITTPVKRRAVRREMSTPEVAKLFHDPTPPISTGSSAIPTLRKPREAVQTGGFGDPNGLPAQSKISQTPNVAAVGSFDLPPGPGYGNGTGGAKGARGVIASSGFGNGVAVGSKNGGSRGSIERAGFANEAAAPAAPRVRQTAAESNNRPVEIVFKPRPVYTTEARQKRIEGEVLLQVVFSAFGQVEVGKIVKGLGYGLDASAESAAREIRFRPAQRDGQPVDSSAIVHITFQLAY